MQTIEIQNKKVIYKILYQLTLQAIKMIIKVDQILTVKLAMIINNSKNFLKLFFTRNILMISIKLLKVVLEIQAKAKL